MELASGWFGGRPQLASAQLREAHDLGLDGVALLPGDPSVDLEGIAAARADLGRGFSAASWDALQPSSHRNPSRAVSSPDPRRQGGSLSRIPDTVDRLLRLGCELLVVPAGEDEAALPREEGRAQLGRLSCGEAVEPDAARAVRDSLHPEKRERQLEALARFLHTLRRTAPGLRLAVAAEASPAAVLDPAGLALLREERSLEGLGYWHDAGAVQTRAALGLDDAGAWLEAGGAVCLGSSLQDAAEGRERLFPGEGAVDFPLLAEYLPRTAVRVLSLAPGYPGEAVREAQEAFRSLGLA
jgi:sugar phosphate isomerase/epimerase